VSGARGDDDRAAAGIGVTEATIGGRCRRLACDRFSAPPLPPRAALEPTGLTGRGRLEIGGGLRYNDRMNREQAIATLRRHEVELRRRGVRRAALFGSVARGEATAASDIDILIELDPDAPIDLFVYAGLKRYIAGLFAEPVDVVNREALKPYLRRPTAAEAVYAF
jgi:predicted nucleotidyltransferase